MPSSDRARPGPPSDAVDPARFWRERPVAVTGATGFLGTHLVDALVELGASVVVLVRDDLPRTSPASAWLERVTVVRGAVEDHDVVSRFLGDYDVRTVFHLAAQSQVGAAVRLPRLTFEANVRGTWVLLDAARLCTSVEQVVVASSDKAYGAHAELPYREEMPLLGANPYDASKACADILAQSYHASFGLPVCTTRCGNLFGPGDLNWQRLVPGTVRSLLRDEPPLIRSDGTLVRDYLFVGDAVDGYLALVERMAGEPSLHGLPFNLSAEEPLSVFALVERLQSCAGTALEPHVLGTATHELQAQYLSAERARSLLGWEARTPLDDALRATIDWYRTYLEKSP